MSLVLIPFFQKLAVHLKRNCSVVSSPLLLHPYENVFKIVYPEYVGRDLLWAHGISGVHIP